MHWMRTSTMFASRSTPRNPVKQGSETESGMYKYVPSTYEYKHGTYFVHTVFVLVCTQYVLSTYSVQGYARGIPRLLRRSDIAVLQLGLLPSTNSVHTWYGTVLCWYVLCYSAIPPSTGL